MNYDRIIDKIFFKNNIYHKSTVIRFNKLKNKKFKNILNYIRNRFEDSESDRETLYRIHYNIESRPKCPVCQKPLAFYGRNNKLFLSHCSNKCKKLDSNVCDKWKKSCGKLGTNRKKAKETTKKRYGVENPFQIPSVIDKIKQINKEKYVESLNKQKQTCLKKYGVEYIGQSEIIKEKIKQTSLKKYGVNHPIQSQEVKNKYNWKEIVQKIINTKVKNKTFNTSKTEDKSYILIQSIYPDVIRQYRSDVYPFACDFYVPSLDLYIECNYHWTHGTKPYNGTEKDNIIVEQWKAKQTEYYNNAINTWTNLDVRKRKIAIENKLNYFVFYKLSELKDWLNEKRNS